MKHHYRNVCGVRVHYIQAGEGNPLLLVHGLGASVGAWRRNIPSLARHHRVYALDIPGHGESDKPEIDYSVPAGVHFLAAFMDALGLEQGAFAGNSVGGLLSLHLALKMPHRVSRLSLVSTAGLGQKLHWFLRLASLPPFGELLHLPNVVTVKGIANNLFYNPQLIERAALDEIKADRNQRGTRRAVVRAIRSGIRLSGLKGSLLATPEMIGSLPMPVLVVWGAEDRLIPRPVVLEALAELANVRVEIFHECGHWPQMEKAAEFNRLALKFLQAPVPRPSGARA